MLSSLPSDDELSKLTIFPYNEDNSIELKRNFCEDKLESTICSLLNNEYGYGYIICGINDEGVILGVERTRKEIDTYILKIDEIFHHSKIVTSKYEHLKPHNIKVRIINCYLDKPLIIITIKADENTQYQLLNGEIYYRLNASNYKIKNIKLFTEIDVKNKIKQVRNETIIECQKIITQMQKAHIKQLNEIKMDRDNNYNLLTEKIIQEKSDIEKQNKGFYCSLVCFSFFFN
jgi:hypothetical protein